MESESARMSSAAEARFRIDYPNSEARVVKVVALDEVSERAVKRVAASPWQRANFFTALKLQETPRGAARPTPPAPLRPYPPTLGIAGGDAYIEEMLPALRA